MTIDVNNKTISAVLDKMYNIRSMIRSMYANETGGNIYCLEESIKKEVQKQFKDKCIPEINIKEFTISLNFENGTIVPNRHIVSIVCSIDNILRNYIYNNTNDITIKDYLNNPNNAIFDHYTVGESIKFLL